MDKNVTEKTENIPQTENKYLRKLYAPLPLYEISIYTVLWVGSLCYSSYSFYIESKQNIYSLYSVEWILPWWNPWSDPVPRDKTDFEWNNWKRISGTKLFPLAILYPVFSQLLKRKCKQWILHLSALYSVICTVYLLGLFPTLFIFLQMFTIFLTFCLTGNALLVWIVAIVMSQYRHVPPLNSLYMNCFYTEESLYFEGYMASVMYAWINTRCVSFTLDRIWGSVPRESSLLHSFICLTAYSFYLPLGIMGPLITSKQFKEGLEKKSEVNMNLVLLVVKQTTRYLVWFLVLEIFISTFLQQAYTLQPSLVQSLSMWSLCGMGYLMGQYFQLKYVMMYGTSSFLAKLDNIDAPPTPICIARVYLYSDMWRHFDVGLHLFMHNYIYRPLAEYSTTITGKIMSSLVCFSFIYLWHGTLDFVLIWSVLNCIGVVFETAGRTVGKLPTYANWELATFGPVGQRRFHALLSTPLFLMSCLSNFFFFAGKQVGLIYVDRILFGSWPKGFPTLVLFLYTGAQFSIEVKNYELSKLAEKTKAKLE